MSEKPGNNGDIDLNKLVITLDLPRLGELAATVVKHFCEYRGIEPPDLGATDEVTEEGKEIALAAWHCVCFMAERREFQDEVLRDLEDLPQQ